MDKVWKRYEPLRKSFAIKYGGMAYRGRGAGRYQKINTAGSAASLGDAKLIK
jgi:hypothetical protein